MFGRDSNHESAISRPLAFVISPQPWAGFHVSKHHYARELAARGWQVVFIDPPTELGRAGRIEITETNVAGIRSLRYQTFFPYRLKFAARPLFDLLMRSQAKRIVRAAGPPDLVWDFDNSYQFCDLSAFRAGTSIFHLVDDVGKHGQGVKSADHVFYLHRPYVEHAGGVPVAGNHLDVGLGKAHAAAARKRLADGVPSGDAPDNPVVGYAGNLSVVWIDWQGVREMVERHPEANFIFWGPLGNAAERDADLAHLLTMSNINFPGLVAPEEIAARVEEVDVWLVPFVSEKVQGSPVNSHKVMEYLSTGRVIVMSWLEAYEGSDLVCMLPDYHSRDLPALFDRVLADLETFNSPKMLQRRQAYALKRTYDQLTDRVLRTAGLAERATSVGAA